MDENKQVTITLKGKINYSHDISVGQAAQIITFIDSATAGTGSLGTESTQLGRPDKVNTAIQNPRDALDASGAKTNPEKIVAFAAYVSHEGDRDVFTLEDIRPLFKRTRESNPGNINRDLDSAIKAGWVAESDVKGEFYITDKASRVLETGFDSIRSNKVSSVGKPRGSSRHSRAPGRAKRQTSGSTIPDAFVGVESISPVIDGYVDYHKISQREKLLWAVNAAKLLGISAVTNKDLAWLTDQLGDGIPTASISVYFRRNQKEGYLSRANADNKILITPQGVEHLKVLASGADK